MLAQSVARVVGDRVSSSDRGAICELTLHRQFRFSDTKPGFVEQRPQCLAGTVQADFHIIRRAIEQPCRLGRVQFFDVTHQ